MDEQRRREIEEVVRRMLFSSGKGEMTADDLARLQPGLARLMPEIGDRTWKLYYAGKAGNWENALYQWKLAQELFEQCSFSRPKHKPAIDMYLRDDWAPLRAAIETRDAAAFFTAFDKAVASGNLWHERKGKAHIVWKLPDHPPPDLDLKPR
jgi:hypothetical protein